MSHGPIDVANLVDLDVDPSLEWNRAYVPPIPPKRSNLFNSGSGYLVTHPSTGGIVMMSPSAVDLAYLNLPRTHDTTTSTPDVEDDLAARMLSLGAIWWPDWVTYSRHKARIDDDVIYDFHFPPNTFVGYPSTGGVWVAQFSPDRYWFDSPGQCGKQRTWPEVPLDFHVRMSLVLSMDEKCEAIRDFGGAFWESVAECGLVAKDLDEGREKWRGFEGFLRSMDDATYVSRWMGDERVTQKLGDDERGDDEEGGGCCVS